MPGGPDSLPRSVRLLLALGARLAPRRHRVRWAREWRAELEAESARRRTDAPPGEPALWRIAMGALPDARALHRLDGPGGSRRTVNERMTMMGRTTMQAARGLLRAPGFSFVAAATLAIGIGATSAMFAVVDHVLLRPFPYADAHEVVKLEHPITRMAEQGAWGMSVAGYFHFRERARSFEEIGGWNGGWATLDGEGQPERHPSASVTSSMLRALGATAVVGRMIGEADDDPGAPAVVMLGERLWEVRFGRDPGIVGSTIMIDGSPTEVIGVLPADFALPGYDADVWRPWRLDPAAAAVNSHYVAALGRLRDGVSLDEARREMIDLTNELPDRFPGAYSDGFMDEFGFTADVQTLRTAVLGDAERPLWVLLGSVVLVLLLACANVANLFLVRAEGRARDVAVRQAMGATRRDLAGYYMAESGVLAGGAAAVGVALAWLVLPVLRQLAPENLPRLDAIAVDGRTVAFAVAAALATAVVLGVLPIFRHAGNGAGAGLADGSRGNAQRFRGGLRGALVVVQMALAVVLLAGAGLMLRTAGELRSIDPGFEPEGAVALDYTLPFWEYDSSEEAWAFTRDLLSGVRALEGVEAAGISSQIPMDGRAGCWIVFLEDAPAAEGNPCPVMRVVTDGFFAAMGIPVLEGREFEATDDALRTGPAIVSRSIADGYWEGGALGRGIRLGNSGPPYHRVVGVVGDVRDQGLTEPAPGIAYFPLLSFEGQGHVGAMLHGTLVVRAQRGTADLVPELRRAASAADVGVAITQVRTLADVVGRSMARTTFTMLLLVIAAGIALMLGAVGLYGVVSYAVSRRRAEIGIRMALGAAGQRVATMVLGESMRLVVPGAVLGILAALVSGRVLESLLFGVSPSDPLTLVGVAAVLTAVAALAAWVPARRAAGVDPATSLRAE